MQYDVFISYRCVNRTWVEVLARNLEECGLKVCLDCWNFIPGDNIDRAVSEAIKESRAGIIVATPEAEQSSWCTSEYSILRSRHEDTQDEFHLVPVIFGLISKFPFISTYIGVDFSDPAPEAYRLAFHRLIMGLQKKAPGSDPQPRPELKIPAPIRAELDKLPATPMAATEQDALSQIFEDLRANSSVVLLAQDGWDRSLIHRAMLAKARLSYREWEVVHLVAPLNARASVKEYLASISDQLGGSVAGAPPCPLDEALGKRMNGTKGFFLLVTRIEEGPKEGRRQFAKFLRGLFEKKDGQFKVVLCGAEQLAELRFCGGDNSLLNTSSIVEWSDPTLADICTWQQELHPADTLVSEVEAQSLLTLCGGHTRLLRQALILRHVGKDMTQIRQALAEDATLAAYFVSRRALPEAKRIAKWLQNEKVARYEHWPEDTALRKLFWDSLLVKRDGYFQWRCPLIREVGCEILKGSLS